MCGIVGIIGKAPVSDRILDALRRLEYRGYDSAGIATLSDRVLQRRRAEGKLRNLEAVLTADPLAGDIGIGHTRWATHGAPSERNAHPHANDKVALVHNGIIENFKELRDSLAAQGVAFETDTDSETIVHLISRELDKGQSPENAVRATLNELEGAFALAILFQGHDDLLICARQGSPLAIGHGDGEMYLGSDATALAPFTNRVTFLDDGDWAVVGRSGARIFDREGASVARPITQTLASSLLVDKGNHRHFMIKEIYEQPEVISHTLAHYLDLGERQVALPFELPFDPAALKRVTICACGTAYYAAIVAKYWFEQVARLPVDVDVASEFRYREAPLENGGLSIFISQSGETADTLASLRYCAGENQQILSVLNVVESSIGRESDVIFPTLAGPEIGVASTKAFTCQLSALAVLALHIARARGQIDARGESQLIQSLIELPRLIAQALKVEKDIEAFAKDLSKARDVLYLGRGTNFPLALEGALKLKEISYIHAEGYAAGELKHGPIALIDENVPVIVIAPSDKLLDKTMSNMQEVAARGGQIILITDAAGAAQAGDTPRATIAMPEAQPFVQPILYALPIQLIAYHTAVIMGTDVDQPRNLAKSVTVE